MSAGSGDQGSQKPQTDLVPRYIQWVDTLFWNFYCEFDKMDPNVYFNGQMVKTPFIDEVFYLRAGKSSPTSISVSLHRLLVDPNKRPDPGFYLEARFTLFVSRQPIAIRFMDCSMDEVTVTYDLLEVMKYITKGTWTLKCVIKMVEFSPLKNEVFKKQNSLLMQLVKDFPLSGEDSIKLAQLLEQETLIKVFSGRQNKEFAVLKCTLIGRTLKFLNELHRNFQMRKAASETPEPLYECLKYILCGDTIQFERKHCITLYLMSSQLGLEFLKLECVEFMRGNLDTEILIDYLIAADYFQDEELLKELLDEFSLYRYHILNGQRWKTLVEENLAIAQSIVDAVIRRVQSDEYEVDQ